MDVPEGERGLFFEEECYICDVLLEKVRQHFIIFWIGKESSNVKRTQTAYHAAQLDHSAKIDATQVRLFQGDEIDEFRGLLPRGFVLVEGASRPYEQLKEGSFLFQVKSRGSHVPRAAQVPVDAASLNSGDCFCLFHGGKATVWFGEGANDAEKEFGHRLGGVGAEDINEGSETPEFGELLGGQKEYSRVNETEFYDYTPRLFQISDVTGELHVEEIYNFTQNDLFEEEIYLVDTLDTLFLWIGRFSSIGEKKSAMDNAKKFLEASANGRS